MKDLVLMFMGISLCLVSLMLVISTFLSMTKIGESIDKRIAEKFFGEKK